MLTVVICSFVLFYYSEAGITFEGDTVMIARRVRTLECKANITLKGIRSPTVYHEWKQAYTGSGEPVGSIPPLQLQRLPAEAALSVDLQRFDNNTIIYDYVSVYDADNIQVHNITTTCMGNQIRTIHLYDDGYFQYSIDKYVQYSNKEGVSFVCQTSSHHFNPQIGYINPAGDQIILYNQTSAVFKLWEAHNASMLCCVYYIITINNNNLRIKRYVENITMVVSIGDTHETPDTYTDSATTSSTTIAPTTSSTTIAPTSSKTIAPTTSTTIAPTTSKTIAPTTSTTIAPTTSKTIAPTTSTTIAPTTSTASPTTSSSSSVLTSTRIATTTLSTTSTESASTTAETHIDFTGTGPTKNVWTIMIISGATALLVLVTLAVCACVRCRRKADPRTRPQLPEPPRHGTDLDMNSPFYLNLLFRQQCEQELAAQEEPLYEEVLYH